MLGNISVYSTTDTFAVQNAMICILTSFEQSWVETETSFFCRFFLVILYGQKLGCDMVNTGMREELVVQKNG